MRSRDFVFSSSPAEFFAAHTKPTDTAGKPAGRHAETDPPQLHRHPRLRPGAHGPVLHARPLLPERLPRRLGERGRSPETTAGRGGGGLREGEFHKPDLITYIVMCLLLFLLVLLIVFFINCQLRNSFFASMPYDRSLREARTSYK